MERTIEICKVDGHDNGRKNCLVTVDLELENGDFSAHADLWNFHRSDIIMGGQCFDDLLADYPELAKDDVFMEVYDLWKHYHLNDMHAGTPAQEKAIEEWKEQGNKYDYKNACEYLKSINLYEVPVTTIDLKANPSFADKETYKYGHGWLKEEIPEKDIRRIECLIETAKSLETELIREDDVLEL